MSRPKNVVPLRVIIGEPIGNPPKRPCSLQIDWNAIEKRVGILTYDSVQAIIEDLHDGCELLKRAEEAFNGGKP